MSQIQEFYANKAILVTGTTGFIGKVLLEKILRSLPQVRRLYVLVRPKRGKLPMDRIREEIFSSECFDLIKDQIGVANFEAMVSQKIVPVEGDITKPALAIDPKMRKQITEDVEVIYNVAASVDFNEFLKDSFRINYFGCLQMLELAKECRNLNVHLHVSTAYVNCIKLGFVEEKIHMRSDDITALVDSLMAMPDKEITEKLGEILGQYPNTYTFTKSLAEMKFAQMRGNTPAVIYRPSIVTGSYHEPFQGWVDSPAAAAQITIVSAFGLVSHLRVDSFNVVSDCVPVDFVANSIIVSAYSQANQDSLTVLNYGTSHKKPMLWMEYYDYCREALQQYPMKDQVFTPYINFEKYAPILNLKVFLMKELPGYVMQALARVTQNPRMEKQALKLQSANQQIKNLRSLFEFFLQEWIYESNVIEKMSNRLSTVDQELFPCNVKRIDWQEYCNIWVYGLQRFLIKQEVGMYNIHEHHQLVPKFGLTMTNDIEWTQKRMIKETRSTYELVNDVMTVPQVHQAIMDRMNSLKKQRKYKYSKQEDVLKVAVEEARSISRQLAAGFNTTVTNLHFYFSHKLWKQIFEQIIVNKKQIDAIKQILNTTEPQAVVFAPTHKSFMDFWLISYVCFHYKLPLPLICAPERFHSMRVVSKILRLTGGFFVKNEQLKDPLFSAIFKQYIKKLIQNNNILELFIEGKRQPAGKVIPNDNYVFDEIAEAFLDTPQAQISDLKIVPITINYERVYEGAAFPFELTGETRSKETLQRMRLGITAFGKNYGRCMVNFATPVSFREFIHKRQAESAQLKQEVDRSQLYRLMKQELCFTFSDSLIIMLTSLVASTVLTNRKGATLHEIVEGTKWTYNQIIARGGRVGLATCPDLKQVVRCLSLLAGTYQKKGHIIEPLLVNGNNFKSFLLLAYYRNNLVHIFLNEALVASALLAIYKNSYKEGQEEEITQNGVDRQKLWEKLVFIKGLLSEEFMVRNQIEDMHGLQLTLNKMQQFGTIKLREEGEKIQFCESPEAKQSIQFLCHLVLPFVDCYWVALASVKQLRHQDKTTFVEKSQLVEKIQWFAETLFKEGFFVFQEACSLAVIDQAVDKLTKNGVLEIEVASTKKGSQYLFRVKDEQQLESMHEEILYFKSDGKNAKNYGQLNSDIQKLFTNNIVLNYKL